MQLKLNDNLIRGNHGDGKVISLRQMYPGYYNTLSVDQRKIHDAGFGFLQSNLAKLDPTVYEPIQDVTYGQDMTIEAGSELVESIEYFTADYTGVMDRINNIFGQNANVIPVVNAGYDLHRIPVYTFQIAYHHSFVEMEMVKGKKFPGSLEKIYEDAVKFGYQLFVNRVAYLGMGNTGGLFTSANVPVNTVPTFTPTTIDTATDAELIALINGMLEAYLTNPHYTLQGLPDTMLIPVWFASELSSRHSALYTSNLRNFLEQNNVAVDEAKARGVKGYEFKIRSRPELDTIGTDSVGRIVLYRNDPKFVKLHLPYAFKHFFTGPDAANFRYTSLFVGQVSEIQLPYNPSDNEFGIVSYWDFLATIE